MKTLWTIIGTSHDLARDVIRSEEYEDFMPSKVWSSREAVIEALHADLNSEIEEHNEHMTDEEDKYPPIALEKMKWHDCHNTYTGQKRWRFWCEFDDTTYIIGELSVE